MTFPRIMKKRQAGAIFLLACLVNTMAFAQVQKSILSLEPLPAKMAESQAVTAEEKLALHAPANFRSLGEARVGELADAQRITIRFAETTKLTKITSTPDFRVEQGSGCVAGNVYQANSTCMLLVRFTPKGAGHRLGKLTIVHTASATPFNVGLGGYGYAPVVSFVPATITTVPGSGFPGSGLLNGAQNLAVDGGDTLYIADTGNNLIRSLDAGGVFNTISSGTLSAPMGVVADTFGQVYFTEPGQNALFQIYAYGPQFQLSGTTSTACTVSAPCSIASQKVFTPGPMATDGYNRIFFADGYYGAGEFVAMSQAASYAHLNDPFTYQVSPPGAFTVDSYDNLYSFWYNAGVCALASQTFSDAANYYSIYKKVAGGKTCGFAGDGGQARNAEISKNIGQMAFDISGNLYFTDTGNQRVRRIDAATGIINTIAGTGTAGVGGENLPATSAPLASPTGVAVDSQGQVYVVSSATVGGSSQVIRKIGVTGSLSYGNVPKGTASAAKQVTLTNTGNSTLTLTNVLITGGNSGEFTIDPATTSCLLTAGSTLASGQSCKVGVIFKPVAAGNRSSSLVFLDNTVTNSNTVQLTGVGALPSATFAVTAPQAGASVVSGTTVKFSASVTSATAPAPTGTVKFSVDGVAVGNPVTISAGAASVNLTGLTVGSHTLASAYSGDANYAVSGTIKQTLIVTAAPAKAAVTVKLASTVAAPTSCTKIPYTVTVSSTKTPFAAGPVQIREGTKVLATGTLSGGKVTVTLPTLAVGTHSLTAYYPGDATHAPATSPAVAQAVKSGGVCSALSSGPVTNITKR